MYFIPFLDPEPCDHWEITFSTSALADSITEEGITFAKGLLGWGSCTFFWFKYSNKDISLSY